MSWKLYRGRRWREDILYAESLNYPKDVIAKLKRESNLYKRKAIFKKCRLDAIMDRSIRDYSKLHRK